MESAQRDNSRCQWQPHQQHRHVMCILYLRMSPSYNSGPMFTANAARREYIDFFSYTAQVWKNRAHVRPITQSPVIFVGLTYLRFTKYFISNVGVRLCRPIQLQHTSKFQPPLANVDRNRIGADSRGGSEKVPAPVAQPGQHGYDLPRLQILTFLRFLS